MIDCRVQARDFDPGHQLDRLRQLGRSAVVTHLAMAEAGEDVTGIVIEQYAAMAKAELGRIAKEANGRWPLAGIILVHRHGALKPGENILFVGVASGEHEAAIEACAFLAGAVRERAPFWRKDMLLGGKSRWMERAD
jgi:molybdopterin synthase catalytic subunit